jgi:predicted GIY-YIG superfamily endonuclease
MFVEKHWVYVLQSSVLPDKHYVGLTSDVDARLAFHNQGRSSHTAKAAPWHLLVAIRFHNSHAASAFERYLNRGLAVCSQSGTLFDNSNRFPE